jgi:alkanesulfonate monooxygenase SsuD/methylene tetrahydromethanopterin reductase-like flavin-dependent oxidoreductase (luciferase family)
MKRGVYLPPFASFGDVNLLVELAVAAEAAGWDGFFTWDHIRYERPVPLADAWIAAAAIAAATERIRLGPLITPLPRRRPHKVAREAVTLDHLSNGRLVLGVGLGIDFWGEFSAFDEPADDDVKRARLLDDGIDTILELWAGGEFLPPPHQQPRIPIWSAANWPMSAGPTRRAARLDGVMPFSARGSLEPDEVRMLRERVGRDDSAYDCVVVGPPERASEYEAAGVTWLIESFWPEAPLDKARATIAAGP